MTGTLATWLRSPYRWVAATLLFGLLASAWIYDTSRRHENLRLQAHFDHLANDRTLRIQNELDQALTALVTLRGLFDASTDVTREEFRLMAHPVLERHPEIKAINWAPRITAAERAKFEQMLSAESNAIRGIFEVSPDAHQPRSAGHRAEYFPVLFSEPLQRNRGAIGIDTYSREENHAAMEWAMALKAPLTSRPLALVQDATGPLAVAVYQPIFQRNTPLDTLEQREAALRGFIMLVLSPATTLERLFAELMPIGMDTQLFDLNDTQILLHHYPGRLAPATIRPGEPLQRSYPLALPGREWTLQITATEGFRARAASRESLSALIAGLLVTPLLSLIVWVNIRRVRQREALAQELRESENRFLQLANNLESVFWIVSPDWRQVIYISPAYERLWGRSAEALYRDGTDWFDAVVEEDQEAVRMQMPGKENKDWPSFQFTPYRIRRPDGSLRWISARAYPVHDAHGQVVRVAGIAEDISERMSHQQHLEELAHFDSLTHLPNRRLLADRMQLAMAHSRRCGLLLGICMLDLDGFKPVNDQYGHKVGDQLLIEVAQRLQDSVRADDTVARLGGDEFVILLGGLNNIKELEDALRRVLQHLSAAYTLVESAINISASIGVTLYPSDNGDADTLLRHADHAMYQAKEDGKNRFVLFNPVLLERDRDNRVVLELIRNAIANDQLRLFYQPIVDCHRGRVAGMEALLRWQHPILGLMAPAEFLPLIEGEDALARNVGAWVMTHAIQQAAAWQRAGLDVPISINVFVQQLRDTGFAQQLQALLAAHPELPPSHVCIEILETTALDDFASVSRLIRACADLGVRFALDDFGTGFSSLTYLRRLPVNSLKIDQSFIRDMLRDPDDLTIVEGVIGLSKAFRHQVIAEGVESADHALMLLELGCHLVQGFGIAKPLPAEQTEAWIREFRPDPRWLDNAAKRLSRDDFQLVLAEVNHRQWLTMLHAWTRQEPAQRSTPPPMNERECNFGRWYYGDGENRYGHLATYRAIEPLHNRVHQLARVMVEQVEAGDIAASRESHAELNHAAEVFQNALAVIRQTVKFPDAGQ